VEQRGRLMPYAKMVIHHCATGETETFSCRVGPESFERWLEEREDLRESGFPDRPPDVDTFTMKAWLPHPGEEDLPFFADYHAHAESDPPPVWLGSWHGEERRVILKVYANDDGSFTVHIDTLYGDRPRTRIERQYAADLETERVWLAIEDDIRRVNEEDGWQEGDPLVTLPEDFVMFDAEMALAEADIARGFINPLPEQGRFLT
jgi:hypothetical protein